MALLLAFAARDAVALSLRSLLTKAKPVVVDLQVDSPAEVWSLDVEEVSARLRNAGAAAVVTSADLLGAVADEQASAKGSFPGPMPVLCEIEMQASASDAWPTQLSSLAKKGAAGIAVRCPDSGSADGLSELLEAATAEGLESLVVVGSEDVCSAAEAGGATAVACIFPGATPPAKDSTTSAVHVGAWDGDDDALQELRDSGYTAMLLLDGCGGDLAAGAGWCEGRVRAVRSNASKQWGGSMFASTSSDAPPPSERNPRLWAQSQRQAREMQAESARSRDLPPPKLSRNTVVSGGGSISKPSSK